MNLLNKIISGATYLQWCLAYVLPWRHQLVWILHAHTFVPYTCIPPTCVPTHAHKHICHTSHTYTYMRVHTHTHTQISSCVHNVHTHTHTL